MVSIVVVTHNRLNHSQECVESIIGGTDVEADLTVIDSGSSDGTPEWLRTAQRSFKPRPDGVQAFFVSTFPSNVGAAVAYNEGFQTARGGIVVRIDNDVVVPNGWASCLIGALESDPELGMVSAELVSGRDQVLHDVPWGIIPPIGVAYFEQPVWHDAGIGSWCMAIRRKVFHDVGYYRTLFGPYALQDNDFEKRAQNAGWKFGYLSGLKVRHLWNMDDPDEAEHNNWKMAEYRRQIPAWEHEWGSPPDSAGRT